MKLNQGLALSVKTLKYIQLTLSSKATGYTGLRVLLKNPTQL